MINKIGFKNIKVFKKQTWFQLAPITILTGVNNSGKSTIQKMLLLLKNSFFEDKKGYFNIETLYFTADIVKRIGGFSSMASYGTRNPKKITFSVEFEDTLFGLVEAYLTYEEDKAGNGRLCEMEFRKNNKVLISFKTTPAKKFSVDRGYQTNENTNTYLHFKRESYKEVVYHEDDYIWHIKESKNFASFYRDALIKLKNLGFEQDKLILLNEKIHENEVNQKLGQKKAPLSEEEKRIKEKYKKLGLEFNDSRAKDELEFTTYHPIGTPAIWDSKNEMVFTLNQEAKKISEIFDQPFEELLIPSELSNLVLGEKDILNTTVNTEDKERKIKEALIQENIFSKEKFIQLYQELERELVEYILLMLNEDVFTPSEFDALNTFYLKNVQEYFFSPRYSYMVEDHYLKNSDNVIARLLLEEIKDNRTGPKINEVMIAMDNALKRNPDKDQSTQKQKKKKNKIRPALKYIYENAFHAVKPLLNELKRFNNHLAFSLQTQNKSIKRHYLNSDTDNTDSLFYKMGKQYVENNNSFGTNENEFIEKWIGFEQGFEIADKLVIKKIMAQSAAVGEEFIGVSYFLRKGKKDYPLGDFGLGVNYFVFLLMQIISSNSNIYNSILAILEEPESNMHPNFQSMLADLLVDAKDNLGLNFLVETHSEYFIRKLQFLVAKKRINPTDIKIYYFNQPDNIPKGEDQMMELTIREDGMMDEDFGPGFFDESIRLTLDLLKLQNRN